MITTQSIIIMLLVASAVIGCSGEPASVTPVGGFNYALVSYDTEPIKNPVLIKIPTVSVVKKPRDAVQLEQAIGVAKRTGLSFEGQIAFANEKDRGGLVFVQLLRDVTSNGQRVTAAGIGKCKVIDNNLDRKVSYHVEFHAPAETGKHTVEIRLLHPPTMQSPFLIAAGEIEVR